MSPPLPPERQHGLAAGPGSAAVCELLSVDGDLPNACDLNAGCEEK